MSYQESRVLPESAQLDIEILEGGLGCVDARCRVFYLLRKEVKRGNLIWMRPLIQERTLWVC